LKKQVNNAIIISTLLGGAFLLINVTVWNEFLQEPVTPKIQAIYPDGIHGAIAGFLGKNAEFNVRTATLNEDCHGLTDDVLDSTDVLIWWGHTAHHRVSDEIAGKVCSRVHNGMGFIALHSAHAAKPFARLVGSDVWNLKWNDSGKLERLWVINPAHPIAAGIHEYIEIPEEEMYGERFGIPDPDELIFISWFATGEVFRSGCVFNRGLGKVFYFRPGHEDFPVYHMPEIQTVISNAVKYVAKPKFEPYVTGRYEGVGL
jgi:trehalose utilization protein